MVAEKNSNLDILSDQTSFLLEKHKESKENYLKLFDGFLSLIEHEINAKEDVGTEEEVKKLQQVSTIVDGHLQQFKQAVDEDITFLEEQNAGIIEAKKQCNPEQENKLFEMLMDGKQLSDTEEFKRFVMQEAKSSFDSFASIMDDLSAVFKEGDIDGLLLYLESMAVAEGDLSEQEKCTGQDDCACEGCNSEITLEFEPADFEEDEESHHCSSGSCDGGSCGSDCQCAKKKKS